MNKTEKTIWTAPALHKLGAIGDVAGNKSVRFNGSSGNNKS
ncbi:hypothetical protein ACFOD9_12020 [Novosphingobium bradum]|uniref:Lasso RiPP family leader peptide-containing protein n=1 Tax=Novosphingobium bradum TaxID=1737444 RepID=A0ABV7IQN2_9SPHN